MVWQDIGFTIGAIILTVSMLPIILNKNSKVPPLGSLPTAAVLFPWFAYLFYTLDLPISAITVGLEGICWWVVLWKRRT